MSALLVAEQRDIGQQQSAVLRQPGGIESVLVHEIELEPALEKCIVQAVHVMRRERVSRWVIEQVRALAHHDPNVRDRPPVDEVTVVAEPSM